MPTHRFLVLLDHHGSRITDEARAAATRLGFDIFLLPGGTTHLLQPWDQLFGPLKKRYAKQRDAALAAGRRLDRPTWLSVLSQTQVEAFKERPALLSDAFKACGIWPFNPEAVLAGLRAELAATQAVLRGALPAAAAADVAPAQLLAGAAARGEATSSNEQQQLGGAEAAAVGALELLGTKEAAAAAAVLRGELTATRPRQQTFRKRLSGWVTGPEWTQLAEAEAAAKQRIAEEKQRKAEAAAARKAAAAEKSAAAERRRQERAAAAAERPNRRPRGAATSP